MKAKGTPGQVSSSRQLFLPLLLFLLLTFLLLLLLLFFDLRPASAPPPRGEGEGEGEGEGAPRGELPRGGCDDPCRMVLVETLPEGLSFGNSSLPLGSTAGAWGQLLASARHSLDIASFYWSLTNQDTSTQEPSASLGEELLGALLELPSRGVALRVAVSPPGPGAPTADLQALARSGAAVRTVDLPRLTGGVLHTKFWLVDGAHLYLGSANMDWRALTQVKEVGAAVYNCSCLAQDLAKLFAAYWALGVPGASIPSPWPEAFSTSYNAQTPLRLRLNGSAASVYISSSPPPLCAWGRTPDLWALLAAIDGAEQFLDASVMTYLPSMEFSEPHRFWPVLDVALRRAVVQRGVRLRLLVACWPHTKASALPFLRSLAALAGEGSAHSLQVRLFLVPSSPAQAKIPYARVNHCKFLVTEKVAYIGTSNWSGDYFVSTAGAALVVEQGRNQSSPGSSIPEQLQQLFQRDWSAPYSVPLEDTARWHHLCGAR